MRLAALLAFSLIAGPAASACEVPPGYQPPTNLQLAADANLIVLGEVVGAATGSPADPAASTVIVHPIVALKGLLPGDDVKLGGMTLADAAAAGATDPLAFGVPSAGAGPCIRRTFAPHDRALFFLRRVNGEWAPAGGPLSRWAQDVAGLDAPWVQLAQLYARASLLPGDDARELLEQRHEALATRSDDPAATAMAADLERSLAGPAPPAIARSDEGTAASGAGVAAAPDDAPADDLARVDAAIDAFGGSH